MSNAALSIAKNMIIGKFADEDDNPKSLSVLEKAGKFSYSNSDVDAHKEAGWIIIEGLCSMDFTWQTYNFKVSFFIFIFIKLMLLAINFKNSLYIYNTTIFTLIY